MIDKVGLAAGLVKNPNHVERGLIGGTGHITLGSYTLTECEGNKEPTLWHDPDSEVTITPSASKTRASKPLWDVIFRSS